MAQEILIRVPDIGDFEDVEVVEILVGPGDLVEVEDPLVSVESDKATMEIPSPVQGRVQEVRVVLGEAVSEGSLLLVLLGDEVPKTGAASEVPGGQDLVSPPPALAGPEPSERPGRSESVDTSFRLGSGFGCELRLRPRAVNGGGCSCEPRRSPLCPSARR